MRFGLMRSFDGWSLAATRRHNQKGEIVKSVRSLTCSDCGNKYRTIFKKGGKVPARFCPACNSDRYVINVQVKSPENDEATNF